MRCVEVDQNLFRYAEKAMGGWSALLMWAHMARCGECRARLAALRSSNLCVSAAMREEVDTPDIAGAVMGLISAEPRVARGRSRVAWAYAVPVIAIAALALYLSGVMRMAPAKGKLIVAVPERHVPKRFKSPKIAPHKPKVYLQPRHERVRHVAWSRPKTEKVVASSYSAPPKPRAVPKPVIDVPDKTASVPHSVLQSYMVVVATAPVSLVDVHLESRDTKTGASTTYSRARGEDGREQVMLIEYTPQSTDMEDPRI